MGHCNLPSSFLQSAAGWVILRPQHFPLSLPPQLFSSARVVLLAFPSNPQFPHHVLRDTQQSLHSLWSQLWSRPARLGIKLSSLWCSCSALGHGHSCPDNILAPLVVAILVGSFNNTPFLYPTCFPANPEPSQFLLSYSHCHCFKWGHDSSSHRCKCPTN